MSFIKSLFKKRKDPLGSEERLALVTTSSKQVGPGVFFSTIVVIASFLPVFMIRSIVEWTENPWGPSILKDNLLKINSGLKGIVFTIYYSRLPGEGERIFSQLGWNTVIPGYTGKNQFHELS